MQDYPWWNDSQRKLMVDSRKFVTEVLVPLAERSVVKHEYPWEAVRRMGPMGWFGATIPKQYGGRLEEWGVTGACILCEEVSRAGVLGAAYSTSLIGATAQLVHNGTEAQKQKWLPRLATGELLGCITMTEPYAGSISQTWRPKVSGMGIVSSSMASSAFRRMLRPRTSTWRMSGRARTRPRGKATSI